MQGAHVIEHGTTRTGRWLRDRRMRITLWIAAAEGLLYLFNVLNWWAAVALALIAVGFWWYAGRANRSDAVRQASWIFAASQLLVLCVPLALALVKAVAIAVIAILAVVALFYLFKERA
jgi:heme O synthase-like polyprenyltransferase